MQTDDVPACQKKKRKKKERMSHRTSLVLPVFLCPLNPQFLVTAGEKTPDMKITGDNVIKICETIPKEQRRLRHLGLM